MTNLITNSYEVARTRSEFLGTLGLGAKRPAAWVQYGYAQHIGLGMLLTASAAARPRALCTGCSMAAG